jgi:hypothetical protein
LPWLEDQRVAERTWSSRLLWTELLSLQTAAETEAEVVVGVVAVAALVMLVAVQNEVRTKT